MERSVFNQLTAAAEIREGMTEIEKIKKTHTQEIEKAVCALINECQNKTIQISDKELDEKFDKMWSQTLKKLSFSEQKITNVFTNVSHHLRINLSHRGSHACELLSQKSLHDCGKEPFKYKVQEIHKNFLHGIYRLLIIEDNAIAIQKLADSIINACTQFVSEKIQRNSNYCDTYIQEILHIIDETLENITDVKTEIKFEVSLKQHICGFAAREFQKMHEDFVQENDPYRCLMKNKEKFRDDFIDVYHERDQCQKKAEEFTNQCLKPAVEDFISRVLGPDITSEMLTCEQFSTRMSVQYSVLLDLLSKDNLKKYVSYIGSYEDYIKTWILGEIVEHFKTNKNLSEFEGRQIQSCIKSINEAISKAKSENLKTFVTDICKELNDKLVISQVALGGFMILNNTGNEQFAYWLTESVNKMAEDLKEALKQQTDISIKLKHLRVQPQNELFKNLIGCGKQCPFYAVPCEAGGKCHTEHFASLHRPQGLGEFRWIASGILISDICSSLVSSEKTFRSSATNNEFEPYKNYKQFYPDWKIPPDVSLEASDYWKYVMARYNKDFANEYNAKPADIPASWNDITKEQAKKSLKESFYIK